MEMEMDHEQVLVSTWSVNWPFNFPQVDFLRSPNMGSDLKGRRKPDSIVVAHDSKVNRWKRKKKETNTVFSVFSAPGALKIEK